MEDWREVKGEEKSEERRERKGRMALSLKERRIAPCFWPEILER